jgi:hypothetical protein
VSEKPRRHKPAKSSKATKATKPTDKAGATEDAPASPSAEERFIEDLIARGEAARPDEDGNLPPGATHQIVDDPEGGAPKLVRRRFSIS